MIYTPEALAKTLIQNKITPLLGIDYGKKTLGLALAHISVRFATPLTTVQRKTLGQDFNVLGGLHLQHGFKACVIGLPLNMDGTEGRMAQAARQFGFYFAQKFQIPTSFWDERLSTFQAQDKLVSQGIAVKKHRKFIDNYAAQLILQNFLDQFMAQNPV